MLDARAAKAAQEAAEANGDGTDATVAASTAEVEVDDEEGLDADESKEMGMGEDDEQEVEEEEPPEDVDGNEELFVDMQLREPYIDEPALNSMEAFNEITNDSIKKRLKRVNKVVERSQEFLKTAHHMPPVVRSAMYRQRLSSLQNYLDFKRKFAEKKKEWKEVDVSHLHYTGERVEYQFEFEKQKDVLDTLYYWKPKDKAAYLNRLNEVLIELETGTDFKI